MSSPSIFADLGKNVTDLFKAKKYSFGQGQLELKHQNPNFKTTTKAQVQDGKTTSELVTKYSCSKLGSSLEVSTDSAQKLEAKADLNLAKIAKVDGLNVNLEAKKAKSKNVYSAEAKFVKDSLAASAKVDCCKKFDVSAVVGHDGLSVGGAILFDGAQGQIADYNAAVQYAKNDFAITVKTADKLDKLNVQVANQVDSKTFVAAEFQYNLAEEIRKIQFGGQYKLDAETELKAKIAQDGQISAVWQHQLNRNAQLSFGLETNPDFSNTKAGFKLSLSA